MQRGFLSERKGKVIPCRGSENRKGAETNGGESSTRNLEAESIRSRAESTGGCVKLKTVTDIRFFLHVKHCQQRKSYQQSGTQATKSQPYVISVNNYICFMLSCTNICRLCIYYGPSLFCFSFFCLFVFTQITSTLQFRFNNTKNPSDVESIRLTVSLLLPLPSSPLVQIPNSTAARRNGEDS